MSTATPAPTISAPSRAERAAFLLPALLFVGVAVGVPVLRVVALSFTRTDFGDDGLTTRFAGLDPYARLWGDSRWWASLSTTAVFTVASVALELLLGTAIALVLHRRFPGRGLARAVVVLPWALPTAVMALAWSWILNDTFGVANDLLQRVGLLDHPVAWLGESGTALGCAVIADVWKTTPFVALIVLAGLQGIPEETVEAARVDGLSAPQRLRHVVLPLLFPSLLVAAAFRGVQAFGAFDLLYVLTGGGPGGSTETVSLYAYRCGFRYLDFGYGAAIATQGVLLVAVLAVLLGRLARGPLRRAS